MSNHWVKKSTSKTVDFRWIFGFGDSLRRHVRDCIDSGISADDFYDTAVEYLEKQAMVPEMVWFKIDKARGKTKGAGSAQADSMTFGIKYQLAGADVSWAKFYVYDHEWTDPRPINMMEL